MNRKSRLFFTGLRALYGAFWLWVALGPLVTSTAIPPQTVPQAQAFWAAIEGSGFMIPLLGACYLLGGLFTIWRRTTPLGLLILSPPMLVIVLFNALLVRSASAWVVLAPVHALLLWSCRAELSSLWTARPSNESS